MIERAIEKLQFLCSAMPPLLKEIDEDDFSFKSTPNKWSKKEILGHLVDSASNNHHRIVRGQFENKPKIAYDNHIWNSGNHYQDMNGVKVISFWIAYNEYLLELVKHIPKEKLVNEVETGEIGEKNIMTIASIIQDYVEHLEHHLRQVVSY